RRTTSAAPAALRPVAPWWTHCVSCGLQDGQTFDLLNWCLIDTVEQSGERRFDLLHKHLIECSLPGYITVIGMDRAIPELLEDGQVSPIKVLRPNGGCALSNPALQFVDFLAAHPFGEPLVEEEVVQRCSVHRQGGAERLH